MSPGQVQHALTFVAAYVVFFTAHQIGDHWVQRHWQAVRKGLPGWPGRVACLGHVASYTVVTVVLVGTAWSELGLAITARGFAMGQLVSAVTHYVADRRSPLRGMARAIGKEEYYDLGAPRDGHDDAPCLGTGAFHLDQSWHLWWLFVAALATASC